MRIRWKGFELPTKVVCEKETCTNTYGKFVAEPFERGYAATIGNSLRRILLSSLEGAALTTVRVEGVQHQYSTIPGVVEDVTDIILNLKKVLLRIDGDGERILAFEAGGIGELTAGAIKGGPDVTILNPDLHIATISDAKASIKAVLTARRGRGYSTAGENERNEIGVIPMDSIFSPVTRVRYQAENTRVGQITNYDKLIIEIWTDGSVTPELALVEAAKILRKHLDPFVYFVEVGEKPLPELTERKELTGAGATGRLTDPAAFKEVLDTSVTELELSVRAENCLEAQNIKTIRQLVSKTENELLGLRNFGKTSLEDIKEKLAEMGLSLGMQIDGLEGMS
ncbi:MAG TPA: DNA-directed RNA polymerase subunit alpha [Planctomycetota bacterium]|nr:DNA-directed RNA polymerase subunit alpha [Planctomycetota bacterium]